MKFILLKLFFIILLANSILLRTFFRQNEKCKKFVCSDDLSDGTCISFNQQEETINIKKCLNESEEICPIMKRAQGELKCEHKLNFKMPKSFPGGKCVSDSDCIYGTCENNFCKGRNLGETCEGHNQCPYKSSCKLNQDTNTKICTALSQDGELCSDDFDCLNNLGCHKGICLKYLSLPLGTQLDTSIRNVFPLCESGFAYNGVCESLKSKEEGPSKCDLDNDVQCKYFNSNGEEIKSKDLCLCGKNPQGFRFCALGNNSNEWNNYLDSLKIVLNFNYEYCNTLERTTCRSAIENSKSDYEKYIFNLINSTKQHELIEADTCVLDIFFPMMNQKNRKNLQNRLNNINDAFNKTQGADKKIHNSFLRKNHN